MARASATTGHHHRARPGRLGEVLVAARITGGSGLPAGTTRRHPTWGLTFLTAGTGRYRDAAHDEPIGPGTLVVVHPGHPHWYGADRGGWDEHFVVFDGVVFDLAAVRGALSPEHPLVRGLPVHRWAARFAAFDRRRPEGVGGRDAEALDLLAALIEARTVEARTVRARTVEVRRPVAEAPVPEGWLARSLELLEGDLTETLDLHAVAAQVGMPYETWRRRVRSETGASPYAHRSARRLAAATDLLVHSGLGVRDIAAATGYTDERHLIRRFREATGLTPRAFRDGGPAVGSEVGSEVGSGVGSEVGSQVDR